MDEPKMLPPYGLDFNEITDPTREMIMLDGGFCSYHRRKDKGLTIYAIISHRPGAGQEILSKLKAISGVAYIQARCPAKFTSNAWYEKRGFSLIEARPNKKGDIINLWRLTV